MISIKRSVINNNFIVSNNNIFSIIPILPQLIFIAIAAGVFYYIHSHDIFSMWLSAIFIGVKIFIALQIIIGAARSLMMPILALSAGLLILFTTPIYHINLIAISDIWQLLIMAVIGFLITILAKW